MSVSPGTKICAGAESSNNQYWLPPSPQFQGGSGNGGSLGCRGTLGTECFTPITVDASTSYTVTGTNTCYSLSIEPVGNNPSNVNYQIGTVSGYASPFSGNCPSNSNEYLPGTNVGFTLTPTSGWKNPAEYPCGGIYVMSGTYDLCATSTGTNSGEYVITMNQNTAETAAMTSNPPSPPAYPSIYCVPPGYSCQSGYDTEVLTAGDQSWDGYTDCISQPGYPGSYALWVSGSAPPSGEVMCFLPGTIDGFGSTEPCTTYGGSDCWYPESPET